jgi:hypothetical protein
VLGCWYYWCCELQHDFTGDLNFSHCRRRKFSIAAHDEVRKGGTSTELAFDTQCWRGEALGCSDVIGGVNCNMALLET